MTSLRQAVQPGKDDASAGGAKEERGKGGADVEGAVVSVASSLLPVLHAWHKLRVLSFLLYYSVSRFTAQFLAVLVQQKC